MIEAVDIHKTFAARGGGLLPGETVKALRGVSISVPDAGSLALIGGVQEVLRDWVTGTERPPLGPIIDDLVTLFIATARA